MLVIPRFFQPFRAKASYCVKVSLVIYSPYGEHCLPESPHYRFGKTGREFAVNLKPIQVGIVKLDFKRHYDFPVIHALQIDCNTENYT